MSAAEGSTGPAPDDEVRTPPTAPAIDDESTRIAPATQPRAVDEATLVTSRAPSGPVNGPMSGPVKDKPRSGTRIGNEARGAETLPGTIASNTESVRQVGRYEIKERLGRGGMATVFRAHDPGIGRDVALKFLHAALCEDEEYRSRFLREARAAGGLSHPNIVIVHDVGEIEGRPYMAMELIEGFPLSEEMEPGKPMPVRDVVIMGIQLARALDYAHARGIVHRDIKPGNLMRVEGTQTVKVTDFGIAHMESSGNEHRTRVGDILGTPQYMSPEQAQGEKLDGRSDLFSAGIMLYQMLTGQRPFQGDSLVALALKIAREEPTPIEKLRPDLPASLRRVVERCLAKAPDRRFQTGKELSDAFTRVLAELDEAQREKDKPQIVPLRLKWAGMMALIVAGVMAVAATVITQRQYSAMMNQVTDNGATLSRFIAAQNAVPVLSEDWVSVDVALQEIMKTGDFQSVVVTDREGIVRAASQAGLEGQPYKAPASEALGERGGGVKVTRYWADGEAVLGFESPITFQDKRVGRVALGLPEKPLTQVAHLSIVLMAVLVLVTVLAVAIAMYVVATWFAKPIKLIEESMGELAKGRFDHRIREQRKDEFGLLYAAFDNMAQALQARQAVSGALATPTLLPRGDAAPVQAAASAAPLTPLLTPLSTALGTAGTAAPADPAATVPEGDAGAAQAYDQTMIDPAVPGNAGRS